MNTATKNLEEDHEHILLLLEVMTKIAGSENPDTENLESIVGIIRDFADSLHHAKEEEIFFPFLTERGFSSSQGPVAVMLHEHKMGRDFVKGIADNIVLYKDGNKGALKDIYANMTGYADLLRNHIGKENNILFRMADRALSESDHLNLLKRFEETGNNNSSKVKPDEYVKRIEELASIYLVKD
jgi:hemerythrin-like domain-containing protein